MQHLDIPKSTPDCIIIPSNKYGLGFKRKTYIAEYLQDYISKEEFDKVINHVTRLAQLAYSEKRKIDNNQISKKILMTFGFCLILALLYFIFSYISAVKNLTSLRIVSIVLLVISVLLFSIVTIAIVFARMPKYPDLD